MTKEELDSISPAFGKGGIFQSIVRTGIERNTNIKVNVKKLKKVFADQGYSGVVELINALSTKLGREVREVGFGSIDFLGVMNGPLTLEAINTLQSLYIGLPRLGVSPLQWLTYLSQGLENIPKEMIVAFDEVSGGFAKFLTAIHNGDYEEIDPADLD